MPAAPTPGDAPTPADRLGEPGDQPNRHAARSDDPSGAAGPRSRPFDQSRLLARLRSTTAGRIAVTVAVTIVGAVVIAVGIVLIPLPGPGWFIVLAGLAIWAIEFTWAERLLQFTRRQLGRWWRWMASRSPAVRVLVALGGLVVVAAVVWAAVRLSTGVDLIRWGWEMIHD